MIVLENILPLTSEQFDKLERSGINYYLGLDGTLEFETEEELNAAEELINC